MCKKPFACVSGARPYVSMWCKQIVYKSLHYKDRTSAPVGFIPANTTVRCTTMIFQTFFRWTLCVALILASKSFGERSYLGVSKGLWLSLKIFSYKEFFFSPMLKNRIAFWLRYFMNRFTWCIRLGTNLVYERKKLGEGKNLSFLRVNLKEKDCPLLQLYQETCCAPLFYCIVLCIYFTIIHISLLSHAFQWSKKPRRKIHSSYGESNF